MTTTAEILRWDVREHWKKLKRQATETYEAWSIRLRSYIRPPALTESERRAIAAAPPCPICGAGVYLTDAGRLDVTHDWHAHYPTRVLAPEPARPPATAAPHARRGGLQRVQPLFGAREAADR